jgi:hypothetical protein
MQGGGRSRRPLPFSGGAPASPPVGLIAPAGISTDAMARGSAAGAQPVGAPARAAGFSLQTCIKGEAVDPGAEFRLGFGIGPRVAAEAGGELAF